MRIGMMTPWSRFCGASMHAEFIGKEWIKQGNELTVFAPYGGPILQKKDEPWVIRHYGLGSAADFDKSPILDTDYEVFVFQQVPEMPSKKLLRLANKISQKSKLVTIIHEGKVPGKAVCNIPWDAVICFDKRYKRFLSTAFPEDKIHIIPYPCHPVKRGDKHKAREKFGLPLDRMIIMIYGVAIHQYFHLLPMMNRINKEKPILFMIFTPVKDWAELYEAVGTKYKFIELKIESLSLDKLYEYLHCSDALIYHRDSSVDVVVPSTIYSCLGAGCPIFALGSNFVETLDMEVIKYGGLNELEKLLLGDKKRWEMAIEVSANYVTRNSAEKVAKKFIKLFKSL
ncbi:MAG: hypothetical protein HY769_09945 [Candidatus Stahlbacteria bacterium]|nr:hypothetical protein [Candidatus Stahlbacteria bacterium]